jgi:circadian clock protein KaiC
MTGERISSGDDGLDEILGGGLPRNRLYLLRGAAGTGKTTLGLQFLMRARDAGEPVLYVTLSQSEAELREIASSHGWDLEGIAVQSLAASDEIRDISEQTIFQSADLRLDETRDAIQQRIEEIQPTCVVYDSLLEIRLLSSEVTRFRQEILGFKNFVGTQNITALLLDSEHASAQRGEDQLENIAHGIIRFDKALPSYGLARRRLEVKKLRGSKIRDGWHDVSIRTGEGVVVFPRVIPSLQPEQTAADELITCGIDEIDSMLGGGLERGTSAMVVGQSGTGKSTLASLYAKAALERNEHVAMFLFEERAETFFRRSAGLGIDLRPAFEDGTLHLFDFNPAEVSPGEFAQKVLKTLEEYPISVMLIDSFTGYLSGLMDSDQAVPQMHSLLKYVSRKGVLSILIVAQHGLLGEGQRSDLDVSYLGDCVLLLRMYESRGVIQRTITAVKKRHGPHDMQLKELTIAPGSITAEPFNPPPPGPGGPVSGG